MRVYTIVDEGYEVEVFTSLKKLVETLYSMGVKYFDCHEGFIPNENQVAKNILKNKTVCAYSTKNFRDEWEYKIQVH